MADDSQHFPFSSCGFTNVRPTPACQPIDYKYVYVTTQLGTHKNLYIGLHLIARSFWSTDTNTHFIQSAPNLVSFLGETRKLVSQ